jgi:peptidoglycan/LPS O-acetylase OafA/YrhL
MRWASALLVVIYHCRGTTFLPYGQLDRHGAWEILFYSLTTPGHQAVIVFFVLSGFLVGGGMLETFAKGTFNGRTYAIARISRLYAVLPVALLLGLALDLLRLRIFGVIPDQATNPAWGGQHISWGIFLANLFSLQRVLAPELGSNTALWSLTNEFWYYLIFPLLLQCLQPAMQKWRRLTGGLLVVTILVFLGTSISAYFIIWLMGAAAWKFSHVIKISYRVPLLCLISAFGIGIAVFRYLSVSGSTDEHVWALLYPSDLFLGLSCAALLAALKNYSWAPASRWGAVQKLNQFLADFSYSLYLSHWPCLAFLYSWFHSSGMMTKLQPDGKGLAWLALMVGLLVAYSYGVSLLTERHTDRLRQFLNRILFRPAAPTPV